MDVLHVAMLTVYSDCLVHRAALCIYGLFIQVTSQLQLKHERVVCTWLQKQKRMNLSLLGVCASENEFLVLLQAHLMANGYTTLGKHSETKKDTDIFVLNCTNLAIMLSSVNVIF